MKSKEAGLVDEIRELNAVENNEAEVQSLTEEELNDVSGGLSKKENDLGKCSMCGGKMVKSRRDDKPVCSKCGASFYLA